MKKNNNILTFIYFTILTTLLLANIGCDSTDNISHILSIDFEINTVSKESVEEWNNRHQDSVMYIYRLQVQQEFEYKAKVSPLTSPSNVKYYWDFNGDGIQDSKKKSGKYFFQEAGEYSIQLCANDICEKKQVIVSNQITNSSLHSPATTKINNITSFSTTQDNLNQITSNQVNPKNIPDVIKSQPEKRKVIKKNIAISEATKTNHSKDTSVMVTSAPAYKKVVSRIIEVGIDSKQFQLCNDISTTKKAVFTIQPNENIELLNATIFFEGTGIIEVNIIDTQSRKASETIPYSVYIRDIHKVNGFKKEILDLSELEFTLLKGKNYKMTISCVEKTHLANVYDCNIPKVDSLLNIDYANNLILFDLKYKSN